jgi:hypothetical protein
LANQFPNDAQGCPGFRRKGLGAPEPGIGRADWPCCREHGAAPVKHHEAGILVSQPAERRKRHHPVSADHDQTPEAVPYAGKGCFAAGRANPIFKNQVTTIHTHLDSVAKEGHNTMSWSQICRG